ncbi:Translation initiation factor eIF-2B subunit delta [Holothuria leucospilota]|uniref:Translation initiation factor eIF2B subunit delta n=1 Tax=Holothuria leucospilota TaxID=206669 RepID=A0A9Q1BBU4_HOLLE|nr:Translation initiation factor eIF-2B subunit delta [Holothuria leucospilota]
MSDASVKSQGRKPEEKPRNEASKVQPSGEKKKLSKQEKREMRLAKQKEQKAQGGQSQGSSNQEKVTEGTQKSKADLKAERRAKQEADRAAKLALKGETPCPTQSSSGGQTKPRSGSESIVKKDHRLRVSDDMKVDDPSVQKRRAKKLEKQQVPQRIDSEKKVNLFNHLDQFERRIPLTKKLSFSSRLIHPAIVVLGLQYAEGYICGANARCIAMLHAFKNVIEDYTTPQHKELSRDLDNKLKPNISFLNQCRPKSVSMGNAIKYVKMQISNIPQDKTDAEAKKILCESIDSYIKKKIYLADDAISNILIANGKIKNDDVIMIYGFSSLIVRILCDAHEKKIRFRVIVVDSRPKTEGKEAVKRLIKKGVKCSYVLLNSVFYMMPEITKVFLGAHALLANGYIMSRVGTSLIAMVAKSQNVPVLVCCETYKFSERAQTDSFVTNELGDPDDLVIRHNSNNYLHDWRSIKNLTVLNLVYDVFPPELVSMVVTELGMIPCTSVPVVLRVKNVEG